MFKDALWIKEYRQAKAFLWMLPAVCLLFMGIARLMVIWNQLIPYEQAYGSNMTTESFYRASIGLSFMRNSALAAVIVMLAVALIGMERRNLLNDFTFSLPFSRARIYMVKWGIGVIFLIGSLLVNEVIDILIILLSPFAEHFNVLYHIKDMVFTVTVMTGLYTFALFIGTMTGSAAAQAILTGIFSIFPIGFTALSLFFIYVNFQMNIGEVFSGPIYRMMVDLSLLFHVVGIREAIADTEVYLQHIWGPLLYIALFLPLGIYCYRHNKLEHNGRIILFRRLQATFKTGVALCFALAVGMLFALLFIPDLDRNPGQIFLPYYIGFIGGGVVSLLLMRQLMKMRFKV